MPVEPNIFCLLDFNTFNRQISRELLANVLTASSVLIATVPPKEELLCKVRLMSKLTTINRY